MIAKLPITSAPDLNTDPKAAWYPSLCILKLLSKPVCALSINDPLNIVVINSFLAFFIALTACTDSLVPSFFSCCSNKFNVPSTSLTTCVISASSKVSCAPLIAE